MSICDALLGGRSSLLKTLKIQLQNSLAPSLLLPPTNLKPSRWGSNLQGREKCVHLRLKVLFNSPRTKLPSFP